MFKRKIINKILSLLLLFVPKIFGQQTVEDACSAFSCGRFQNGMCDFSQPQPSGSGGWEWAQGNPDFNANLGIWKDAESTMMVFPGRSAKLLPPRNFIQAKGPGLNDRAITSKRYRTDDQSPNKELRFKYWLASYGSTLRICLDGPDCTCPSSDCLFSDDFTDAGRFIQGHSENGPLKAWRPCKLINSDWNCSNEIKQSVKLPKGSHEIFFVADGLRSFSFVGLDSVEAVDSPGGPKCTGSGNTNTNKNSCYKGPQNTIVLGHTIQEYKVGRDPQFRGTADSCWVLCDSDPDCASVLLTTTGQKECLLFDAKCGTQPEHCYPGNDQGEYYEKVC